MERVFELACRFCLLFSRRAAERNVMDHLPEDQKDQARSAMRAAWRLDIKNGIARLKKVAEWLQRDYPSAASSLMEGMEECFTINRLDVPPSLHRCLATTNIIESPHAGVRMRSTKSAEDPFRCPRMAGFGCPPRKYEEVHRNEYRDPAEARSQIGTFRHSKNRGLRNDYMLEGR